MLTAAEVLIAREALYVAYSDAMISLGEQSRLNGFLIAENWVALFADRDVLTRLLPLGEPYKAVITKLLGNAAPAPVVTSPTAPAPGGVVVPPPAPSPVVVPQPAPVEGEPTAEELQWLASVLAPYLATATVAEVTSNNSAVLRFRANTDKGPWQSGSSGEMVGNIQLNGWDAGMRIEQNWNGTGQPSIPWCYWGPDQNGSWSYAWYPPVGGPGEGGDRSTVAGADYFENLINNDGIPIKQAYQGQTFIIDGGAQQPTNSQGQVIGNQHHAMLAAQREGWDIFICVTPQRTPGNTPTNMAVIMCYAGNDAEPNRVKLFIEGDLRQVKSGPNGSGPGGVGRALYIDNI